MLEPPLGVVSTAFNARHPLYGTQGTIYVASAVDNKTSHAVSPADSGKVPNPVAREIAVIVAGARPGGDSGKRELFNEATSTVLVLENGGVIPLSAAVTTGQLLFVTNQESQREVVAHVIRQRSMGPSSCYVELEFSEPAPGFWGVDFSAAPEPVKPTAQQTEAQKLVQSSEPAARRENAVPLPGAKEVDALKSEVDALREQLKSLEQTQKLVTNAGASREPQNSETLEKAVTSEAQFAEDDLLPKPALDFSNVPALVNDSSKSSGAGFGAFRIGFLSAALLFVAAGAGLYMHWIPLPKMIGGAAPGTTGAPPSAGQPAEKASEKRADSKTDTPPTADLPGPKNNEGIDSPKSIMPTTDKNSAVHVDAADAQGNSPKNAEPARKSGPTTPTAKRDSIPELQKTTVEPPIALTEAGPLTPPKLIKSVKAVPPPEAVRGFATGDVELDAIVDANGRVKSANVLSGPDSLKSAAIDAVKQYKYEPAMQGGKPVAAHVKVTVQFWYEP